MRILPGPETRAAIVRHPVMLAGLAVVALLALTAGALVVIDSVRGSGETSIADVVIEAVGSRTAVGGESRVSAVFGEANRTAAVRTRPSPRGPVLATLHQGSSVTIDGRTDDDEWLQILLPPRGELHGWVEAEALDVTGSLASVFVATPQAPVLVNLPTPVPILETATPEVTPDLTGTPGTKTPGAEGDPDLAISAPGIRVINGQLIVPIVNQGKGPLDSEDLVIAIFDEDETKLLGGTTLPGFTLGPGLSISVSTGYPAKEDEVLLIIVDPNGEIDEEDNTNNRVLIEVAIGVDTTPEGEAATVTPTPEDILAE